jgi:hypothetical protein
MMSPYPKNLLVAAVLLQDFDDTGCVMPDLILQLVIAGIILTGLLSFLKWVLGDIGDFIRFLKKWRKTL